MNIPSSDARARIAAPRALAPHLGVDEGGFVPRGARVDLAGESGEIAACETYACFAERRRQTTFPFPLLSTPCRSQVHIPPLNHFSLWISNLDVAVAHLKSKVVAAPGSHLQRRKPAFIFHDD